MNIIILTFCYFIYCVLIYISYILHCIFFVSIVDEKVENKLKSNQINDALEEQFVQGFILHLITDTDIM